MGRRRVLLVIVAVIVALPLLAVLGVGAYLQGGGLAREAAHAWTAYGMPGELRLGRIRLLGPTEAEAEAVELGEAGAEPLATARRVWVRFDALDRRVLAVRVAGLRAGLDARRRRFLEAIIAAEDRHPPTRAPRPLQVEIDDAELALPGGLTMSGIRVRVEALGPRTRSTAEARIAGQPLRLLVTTARAGDEAPVTTTVEISEGRIAPRALLDALAGLGYIAPLDRALDQWLPAEIDASGTRLERVVVSDTARGELCLRWEGGELRAALAADARRAQLTRLLLRDARWGELEGELTAARDGSRVQLVAARWQPGPALPLPAKLPLADIARLLPKLELRWPVGERQGEIAVSGANQARLALRLGGERPPRVLAEEVPLTLLAPLLPREVTIAGGQVVQGALTLAAGRRDLSARLSQLRVLADGWSIGPLDAQVAAVIGEGLVQASGELLSAEPRRESAAQPPLARLQLTWTAQRTQIAGEAERVERLLALVRGPAALPELAGRLTAAGTLSVGDAVSIAIDELTLRDGAWRTRQRDWLRALATRLQGRIEVQRDLVRIALDGQLMSGELRLPGQWLPVAALTPRFALAAGLRLSEGRMQELEIAQLLVRAADAAGQPLPGGFSAQFSGTLRGERQEGELRGVIDHAPLAFLSGLVLPPDLQISGEGAIVVEARFRDGEIQRIEGTFLPLGVGLDIAQGRLRIDGITGGLRFSLGDAAEESQPSHGR
ncbi:MAG: hypothetical protein RMM29_00730 [Planctomycetota bacterium]|nr:hypothetical protein [Planctomycetota bacterium]MCX8039882.1 hypothetical protein [Planctomycetota bacterium]MDW8372159.1 hypothetical protein [Planctomycetota bacterium]